MKELIGVKNRRKEIGYIDFIHDHLKTSQVQ
jgi:hypothetical protein